MESDILGFLLTSFHSLKNEGIFSFVLNCGMYSIPPVAKPNKYQQVCLGCGSGSSFLPPFFFWKDVFGMVAKLKLLTNKEVKPKQLPYGPGALAGSLSLVSLMVSRACFCE